MKPLLQINHLCFDYADIPLLKGINLSIPSGHLLHLKGDNGSGKTTLLKILAGLLLPTKGHIYYNDQCIHTDKTSYQRHICYVGHKLGIHPSLTPSENTYFDLHQGRKLIDWERTIEELGLTGHADTPCGLLSAGQRRRVALIRLLISDARIWLLDEPFVALDLKAQLFLMQMILKHLAEGGLVILTSHQPLPLHCEPRIEYLL